MKMTAKTICSLSITTAVTASVQTVATGFGKPLALDLQAKFTYVASAATSVTAYVQTTLDNGLSWMDVYCFQFTTASDTKVGNLSGLTPKTTPVSITDGTLTANTGLDGFLSDQYRVKVTSVGTYGAGTTLVITAEPRG